MAKDKAGDKIAKQKLKEERLQDLKKRDDEMAEGKSPDVVAAIYSRGGKYYCAECQSELAMHQPCPNCHMEIDWERANFEHR